MTQPASQAALVEELKHAKRDEPLLCEITASPSEIVISANKTALLHIATSIVRLVYGGRSGSHFTMDRADIAPDAEIAVTISLVEPNKLS